MAKSYDFEAAQSGLQQLKVCLESILVQANTFISTVQGAADENSAKNIKDLVESFETTLKTVTSTFENELVAKAEEAVATIGSIVEANG